MAEIFAHAHDLLTTAEIQQRQCTHAQRIVNISRRTTNTVYSRTTNCKQQQSNKDSLLQRSVGVLKKHYKRNDWN